MSAQYLGYFFLFDMAALGLFGMNIRGEGPMDPRFDPYIEIPGENE